MPRAQAFGGHHRLCLAWTGARPAERDRTHGHWITWQQMQNFLVGRQSELDTLRVGLNPEAVAIARASGDEDAYAPTLEPLE
jgi:hypothetical protein